MKFLWTTINVRNLDESISFYSNLLDLKVLKRFPAGPGIEIVFMGNSIENETLIEFIQDSKNSNINLCESVSIGFSVESIDEILETVKNRSISIINGPIETSDLKFIFIKDPNGMTIQFVENIIK